MAKGRRRRRTRLVLGGGLVTLIALATWVVGPGGWWSSQSSGEADATGADSAGGGSSDAGRAVRSDPTADTAPPTPRGLDLPEVPRESPERTPPTENASTGPTPRPDVSRSADAPSETRIDAAAGAEPRDRESTGTGPAGEGSPIGRGGGREAEVEAGASPAVAAERRAAALVDEARAALRADDFDAAASRLTRLDETAGSDGDELVRSLQLQLRGHLRLALDRLVTAVRDGRALDATDDLRRLRALESPLAARALDEFARERGWPPLRASIDPARAAAVPEPPPLRRMRVRWRDADRSGTGEVRQHDRATDAVAIAADDGLFPVVPRRACEPLGLSGERLVAFALDQAAHAVRHESPSSTAIWLAVALEAGASPTRPGYARVVRALSSSD